MSLIFGLAHAPGFIFRHAGELEGLAPHPSALDAVAYSIVVLAVSGIAFGVICANKKSFRSHARPCYRRSPAEFRQFHTDVVLIKGLRLDDRFQRKVQIEMIGSQPVAIEEC